jgi:hypothetical protein
MFVNARSGWVFQGIKPTLDRLLKINYQPDEVNFPQKLLATSGFSP